MSSRDVDRALGWATARRIRVRSMLTVALTCAFTCALVASPASAQVQSRAAALAALAKAGDAVVTIVAYRDGMSDVTSGVGVRVADGRVVTSLRHLRGATRADVFNAAGDLLATVTTLDQAELKLDLAVLPRSLESGQRIILARRSAVVAQKVSLLGPKKGTVRSVIYRTVTSVEPDAAGRLIRVGAPIPASAAGSPVVNARSELVGLALGSIPGREEGDIVVDVVAVRELLARPPVRLGFPARDGSLAAAKPAAETKPGAAVQAGDPSARPRAGSGVFPERYGNPIAADTAGSYALELFGCVRLESRKKVYCYLRVTNLGQGSTFGVSGADLADSTRRKIRAADNLLVGESIQQVSGWRKKALVPLRELESVRWALEFEPPEPAGQAARLMIDVSGERPLWFGPFVLQRAP